MSREEEKRGESALPVELVHWFQHPKNRFSVIFSVSRCQGGSSGNTWITSLLSPRHRPTHVLIRIALRVARPGMEADNDCDTVIAAVGAILVSH